MNAAYVLDEELMYVEAGRSNAKPPSGVTSPRDHPEQDASHEQDPEALQFATDEGRRRATKMELCGLAFSGGGIRSATFNLGVLQALAELGFLKEVDYLSTVSGGGYIGSWLTAWIHRLGQPAPDAGAAGKQNGQVGEAPVVRVQSKLRASVSNGEPAIRFLREHSNYLTPRTGFFGADTWSAISTYLRNLTLNLAILGGILLAAILLPRLLLALFRTVGGWGELQSIGTSAGWLPPAAFDMVKRSSAADWIAVAWLLPALALAGINLRFLHQAGDEEALTYKLSRQSSVLLLIVLPTIAATFFIAISTWTNPDILHTETSRGVAWMNYITGVSGWWVGLWLILVLVWHVGASKRPGAAPAEAEARSAEAQPSSAGIALAAVGCAVVSGVLAAWLLGLIDSSGISATDAAIWMTFGVPVAIGIIILSAVVNLGLMGRLVSEEVREWWSRLGGWLLIFGLAWMGVCGISLFSPVFFDLARGLKIPAAAAWLATTAFGVLGGRSASLSGKEPNRLLEIGVSVAPYVFILGLLLALSAFADWALSWGFPDGGWMPTAGTLVACLVGSLVLSWRVDVNAFSLQPLYRNRLVRCYLGASHTPREPHPFTGFDPDDDIFLKDLAGSDRALRPYPLINVALNLVKGKDLAAQERKATSFTMAPLHCGFDKYYRRTTHYAQGGLMLGEAVATSGAAASPNMGYHSNPALAFLMTIFNVRLGMWLGNPKNKKRKIWAAAGPRVGLIALLSELFGNTSDDARFVYLSDGGHFDNLGIYELLRRRCRFIIACDASADPHVRFDDLGSVIRKCRTDFGVDITLDTTSLQLDPHSGRSNFHCAVAQIQYPGGTTATLLYLKASLTGREPVDVLNFAAGDRSFPHQSTADQWFGESQFESYRRLGYHCAHKVFEGVLWDEKARTSLEGIFTALRERWYPPTGIAAGTFARHAATLDCLNERIRANPQLSFLDAQIVPSWPEFMEGTTRQPVRQDGPLARFDGQPSSNGSAADVERWLPDDAEARRDGFYLCASVIQLMENVYTDLGLETHCDHPDNRGWMNLFRHWSWCSMLRVTWALTAATYGARFQTFCRERLALDIGIVAVEPTTFDKLNFVEQGLATTFGESTNGGLPVFSNVQLYSVKLRVKNPDARMKRDVSRVSREGIDFGVGFAVLDRQTLKYLRIQDHLRKMGLAREALRDLLKRKLVAQLSTGSAPRSEHEEIANEEGLRRIFDSVKVEIAAVDAGRVPDSAPPEKSHAVLSVPPEI